MTTTNTAGLTEQEHKVALRKSINKVARDVRKATGMNVVTDCEFGRVLCVHLRASESHPIIASYTFTRPSDSFDWTCERTQAAVNLDELLTAQKLTDWLNK